MTGKIKQQVKKRIRRDSLLGQALTFVYNPILYLKKRNILPWKPNLKTVEIEVTSICNLACLNCDRSIGQAPSNEAMNAEQIQKFIDKSIKLNWNWKRIRLLGGEPTLHPQLFQILEIIDSYRKQNPECRIELTTNGHGKRVNEMLEKLPEWVNVWNSAKESSVNEFRSYNVAPIDLEQYRNAKFFSGCTETEICGLGLTRYGFYCCGAGASIDRVFGFDVGIKELSNVTTPKLRKQMKLLCQYCGHFKYLNKPDHKDNPPLIKETQCSKTWEKVYKNFKENKPKLTLY